MPESQGNTQEEKDLQQNGQGVDQQPAESTEPAIVVEVAEDGMEAFIMVPGPDSGRQFSVQDARTVLADQGIVEGIETDLLERIFKYEMFGERLLIASGSPPTDGIDGVLQYLVDVHRQIKPKIDKKGNADYKDVNLFCIVKKGDQLTKIVPPIPGVEGKTVTGEVKTPVMGAPINVTLGPNVAVDPKDPNVVLATTDGSVTLKRGNVLAVDPVIVIDGDVDYSTGNIDFSGSVRVRGDVKSDFSVKAKGDVEIQGVVEDSTVEAGGNVLLKNGAVGKGKGRITAGGSITLKFCTNHAVSAGGDIAIGEGAMHSRLEAGGTLTVRGNKGLIVGGETVACQGIVAKTLGNENYQKTMVAVGISRQLLDKMEKVDEAMSANEKNMTESSKVLFNLNRERKWRGELSKDKAAIVRRLERLQAQLKMEREELPQERKRLEEEMQQFRFATVHVLGNVFPGVVVAIQDRRTKVTDAVSKVQFSLINDTVTPTPLKKED